MPFCGECGAEVPAGINFCGKCGKPLTSGQSQGTYQQVKNADIKPPPIVDDFDFDDIEKRKRVDRIGIGLGIGGCFAMPFVVLFLVLLVIFLILKFSCEVFSDNSSGTRSEQQQKVVAPTRQNNTGSAQSGANEDNAPIPSCTHRLQGAFSIQIMADSDIDIIQKEKSKAEVAINQFVFIVFIEPYYKLWVGDFNTKTETEAFLPTVKSKGYKDAWIVSTKAITGSTQNSIPVGKIDNRLIDIWVGEGDWLIFRADGTFGNDHGIKLGTWYTEGNKITMTSNGQTTTESYVVNITVTQDEGTGCWVEGTLRIGNKKYELWTP